MFLLQLKNMVNALFSSKHNGTKALELSGIHFGWKEIQVSIQVLFVRFVLCCTISLEYVCKRIVGQGLVRMVPKLRETCSS